MLFAKEFLYGSVLKRINLSRPSSGILIHRATTLSMQFNIDRHADTSLTEQIRRGISAAINAGKLQPGARLPSWQDLAAQLGVGRGTVRAAYERLIDTQQIMASGAAGTFVADRPPAAAMSEEPAERSPLVGVFAEFSVPPRIFRMGVPAQDAFPFKLWSRILVRAARAAAASPVSYPDPRGEPLLRHEIVAHLAIARGVSCTASQVFITGGYAGALGAIVRTLGLEGSSAWTEEPGYVLTRTALSLARVTTVPVPVDSEGINVAAGVAAAPDAALAVVTPGQQAPLGTTMSPARRRAILDWAERGGAWIIEDDYLSELQLKGRAAPALAANERAGRVIYVGTFSKTISPALRLGFLVAPPDLISRFGDVAACLAPAPAAAIQFAVAEFMRDGHYLRHLRRMKRLYAGRRDALKACLGGAAKLDTMAGLALLWRLPDGARDAEIAKQALSEGLSPSPLSLWCARPASRSAGLLLGVTNASEQSLAESCSKLRRLVDEFA
jgi:GntR family transcriptional regulator / MocR family aminotransferase